MVIQEMRNSGQETGPAIVDGRLESSLLIAAAGLVRRRWRLMLITVFLVESLFVLFAYIMTPIYRGEVLLAPQTRSLTDVALGSLGGGIGGISSLLGIGRSSSPENDFSLAVLDSYEFARSFIEDEKLLPVLFSSKWDAQKNNWREADPSKHPTTQDAVRFFNLNVKTVSKDLTTGMVRLRIDWRDRHAAASWANKLAARLNQEVQRRATEESARLVTYLSRELLKTQQTEVREALSRVMESELKRQALANVSEEYAFRIVDPAVVPDPHAYLTPKKKLLALVGFILGIFLAFVFASLREYSKSARLVMSGYSTEQSDKRVTG